ncbi:hypothetical protein ABZ801_34265 [Actinomadura sp. NPDC047616]|uniref:hypothetical protein n=1 Tax=Actinomadura sp. NPDC047616 TaxID=3155914 RepID=UPI0033EAAE1C
MEDDRAPDDMAMLWRLRRAYPHWAFLHDTRTSTWTALRGRDMTIVRRDPTSLWFAVDVAQSQYWTR